MWGAEIGRECPSGPQFRRFNGAAPCGARKFPIDHQKVRLEVIASTGPRLVGRGNLGAPLPAGEHVGASTGPRLVGRGNAIKAILNRFLLSRFNGAAPCGARKFLCHFQIFGLTSGLQRGRALWGAEIHSPAAPASGSRCRFNGAAPCGARKYVGHERRGRDDFGFNGAAPCGARKSDGVRPRAVQRPFASTGPRLVGRGNRPPILGLGRRLASFNGAAPCGARKSTRHQSLLSPPSQASTGPRLVGRGNCGRRRNCCEAPTASTGPRLVGRGNPEITITPSMNPTRLQRGRALWGAEIGRSSDAPRWQSGSFNGAAPCGARKWGRNTPPHPGRSGFNGAAPCGARKCRLREPRSRRVPALQRGRALWGAEIGES